MCQERGTNPERVKWVFATIGVCVRESLQVFEALEEFDQSLYTDRHACEEQRADIGTSRVQAIIAIIVVFFNPNVPGFD